MKRFVAASALAFALASCGGASEEDALSARADASIAVSDITTACAGFGGAEPKPSELSSATDKLLAAWDEARDDSEVKSLLREAAGTLRDCDQADLAGRIDDATDE